MLEQNNTLGEVLTSINGEDINIPSLKLLQSYSKNINGVLEKEGLGEVVNLGRCVGKSVFELILSIKIGTDLLIKGIILEGSIHKNLLPDTKNFPIKQTDKKIPIQIPIKEIISSKDIKIVLPITLKGRISFTSIGPNGYLEVNGKKINITDYDFYIYSFHTSM